MQSISSTNDTRRTATRRGNPPCLHSAVTSRAPPASRSSPNNRTVAHSFIREERLYIRKLPTFPIQQTAPRAYLDACTNILPDARDWNAEFQLAWGMEDGSYAQALLREQRVRAICAQFEAEARPSVEAIVRLEDDGPRELPHAVQCFRVRNIFFRVLPDSRSGRNYIAALRGVLMTRSELLRVPLSAMFYFRGMPVLVQALIPLSAQPPRYRNTPSPRGDDGAEDELRAEMWRLSCALHAPHYDGTHTDTRSCTTTEESDATDNVKSDCGGECRHPHDTRSTDTHSEPAGRDRCVLTNSASAQQTRAPVEVYRSLDGRYYVTSCEATLHPLFPDDTLMKRQELLRVRSTVAEGPRDVVMTLHETRVLRDIVRACRAPSSFTVAHPTPRRTSATHTRARSTRRSRSGGIYAPTRSPSSSSNSAEAEAEAEAVPKRDLDTTSGNDTLHRLRALCTTLHAHGVNLCLLKQVLRSLELCRVCSKATMRTLRGLLLMEMICRTVKQQFYTEVQGTRIGYDEELIAHCLSRHLARVFVSEPRFQSGMLDMIARKYGIVDEDVDIIADLTRGRHGWRRWIVQRVCMLLGATLHRHDAPRAAAIDAACCRLSDADTKSAPATAASATGANVAHTNAHGRAHATANGIDHRLTIHPVEGIAHGNNTNTITYESNTTAKQTDKATAIATTHSIRHATPRSVADAAERTLTRRMAHTLHTTCANGMGRAFAAIPRASHAVPCVPSSSATTVASAIQWICHVDGNVLPDVLTPHIAIALSRHDASKRATTPPTDTRAHAWAFTLPLQSRVAMWHDDPLTAVARATAVATQTVQTLPPSRVPGRHAAMLRWLAEAARCATALRAARTMVEIDTAAAAACAALRDGAARGACPDTQARVHLHFAHALLHSAAVGCDTERTGAAPVRRRCLHDAAAHFAQAWRLCTTHAARSAAQTFSLWLPQEAMFGRLQCRVWDRESPTDIPTLMGELTAYTEQRPPVPPLHTTQTTKHEWAANGGGGVTEYYIQRLIDLANELVNQHAYSDALCLLTHADSAAQTHHDALPPHTRRRLRLAMSHAQHAFAADTERDRTRRWAKHSPAATTEEAASEYAARSSRDNRPEPHTMDVNKDRRTHDPACLNDRSKIKHDVACELNRVPHDKLATMATMYDAKKTSRAQESPKDTCTAKWTKNTFPHAHWRMGAHSDTAPLNADETGGSHTYKTSADKGNFSTNEQQTDTDLREVTKKKPPHVSNSN